MNKLDLIDAVLAEIDENPRFATELLEIVFSRLARKVVQEREQRCEWETIAITALDWRLFKSNKKSIAQRIQALQKTNCLNWTTFLKKMQK